MSEENREETLTPAQIQLRTALLVGFRQGVSSVEECRTIGMTDEQIASEDTWQLALMQAVEVVAAAIEDCDPDSVIRLFS